ncbi:DNA mismatch repair protein MSH5 [Madurella mycetomatis]|uniref:DNA mismatch repair protein MSH5 n=1 Tax=Madurella mycetomatis TaxID=100816 RepID=A0A175WDV7_9PEZI|nr:DNA mismatch repair protein MSH5 [Madurella mycetomatis]
MFTTQAMPQLGFLIAVRLDPDTEERMYDTQYGDLLSRIADEEIEVIMGLVGAVLDHEEAIISASELFGELDSLLALALAAEKYNWAAPIMTSSNVIGTVEGRHPLPELLVPAFIPNDRRMAGGCGTGGVAQASLSANNDSPGADPSMLVLTGPKNSGKSVYMKQVALIVYLAHAGSYVPATRATIGITHCIQTRITTQETVVNDESAFLVDVKQAAFSMNFATRRSLLLIDEFGKGTTAESGSALFAAHLGYFLDLGAEQPKEVAFAHMDARLDAQARDVEDQVTFLYRLPPGRGPSSLGVLCAAMSGVPGEVVERAEAIIALWDRDEDLVTVCLELTEAIGRV